MIDKDSLKDYPRPDWLPDWTDQAGYTEHGENAGAWAWEFLRRNPEYQADYAHYMGVPWCYPNGGGKTPKLARGTYPADDDEMIFFDREPPAANPSETFGEYVRRTGREPERLEPALLQKWGVSELRDPASDSSPAADHGIPPYQLSQSHGRVFVDYFEGMDRAPQRPTEWLGRHVILQDDWKDEDDPFMVVLAFDLRRNPNGQLQMAREILAAAEQEWKDASDQEDVLWRPAVPLERINVTAPRTSTMLECLRVFDAVWTIGPDRQRIAAALWPHKGATTSVKVSRSGSVKVSTKMDKSDPALLVTLDRRIMEATQMVNSGYRDLLRWSEFPKNTKNAGNKTREKKTPPPKKMAKSGKNSPKSIKE